MTDGPVAKKYRIWNPAVSENQESETRIQEQTQDEKPLDCTAKTQQFQFPEVFQNYLQLAPLMLRLQQQRQMEELARRQFLSTVMASTVPTVPTVTQRAVTSSKTTVTMSNPIVASALGSSLVNENCCAVCGSVFRLTGDLVQHMRNNHRKTKFKRKADLRQ